MKPSELRELLLYGPPGDATHQRLPREATAVWFSRPSREHLNRSKMGMYGRAGLIIAAVIYFLFYHYDIGEGRMLLFVVAAYEIAYYLANKERLQLRYMVAQEAYAERVEQLIESLYPSHKSSTAK